MHPSEFPGEFAPLPARGQTVKDREIWIGCDPGLTGGLTALDGNGKLLSAIPMPVVGLGTKSRKRIDVRMLRRWVEHLCLSGYIVGDEIPEDSITWAIERVSSMKTDGVVQAYRFGAATHAVFAAAAWSGARLVEISPKDWIRTFLRNYPKNWRDQIKASAALAAQDRWPGLSVPLKLKKNWGIADAGFIADAARLIEQTRGSGLVEQ